MPILLIYVELYTIHLFINIKDGSILSVDQIFQVILCHCFCKINIYNLYGHFISIFIAGFENHENANHR